MLKSFGSDDQCVDYLVDVYNFNLHDTLDIHAPSIHREVNSRDSKWYTKDLREAKRQLCRLERKYMKQRTVGNSVMFRNKCRIYKQSLIVLRRVYFCGRFDNCENDKKLLHIVNCLTNITSRVLSETKSNISLDQMLSSYFYNKIYMVREAFATVKKTSVPSIVSCSNT